MRATRATYEKAYNAVDSTTLLRIWMGTFVFTVDRGSTANVRQMRDQAPRLIAGDHDRHSIRWKPETIRVYWPRRMAVEMGTFTRTLRGADNAPLMVVHGVYTAQWFRGPQGWQLEAEIMSPISCDGEQSYCGL